MYDNTYATISRQSINPFQSIHFRFTILKKLKRIWQIAKKFVTLHADLRPVTIKAVGKDAPESDMRMAIKVVNH